VAFCGWQGEALETLDAVTQSSPSGNGVKRACPRSTGDLAANAPDAYADEFLTDPGGRPAAWSAPPTASEIDKMASLAAWELPGSPDWADLAVPDASWAAFYASVDCLHDWLRQLLADLQRVNAPITAHMLADDLVANLAPKLAELERAGTHWLK
jgi:hypothetical protein